MMNFTQALNANAYPGRGILIGKNDRRNPCCDRLFHHGALGQQPQPRF